MDSLHIKISSEDAMLVYKFLDSDDNGSVDYNEFCRLCEERQRGIDPFYDRQEGRSRNIDSVKSYLTTRERSTLTLAPKAANLYLVNMNLEDLEKLSKFKPLSQMKTMKESQRNKSLGV